MQLGTLHTVEGIIRKGQRSYSLAVHGGGEWALEIDRRLPKYLDQSVTVEGVRTGFNRLEVVRIKRDGEEWPTKPNWTIWFDRWRKR
jgi:Protein of unknown function (DUF5818)